MDKIEHLSIYTPIRIVNKVPKASIGCKKMETKPNRHPTTLNARAGAIAIIVGALGVGSLALLPQTLAPLSLLSLGIVSFGLWAFSDEMGIEKPLVRAGFVAFAFAIAAKSQALLHFNSVEASRYYIFYGFSILAALLIWSAAFLHRRKSLKILGAAGVVATVSPIFVLISGHIVVGVGSAFGVAALFSTVDGSSQGKFAAVDNIDLIFAAWAIVTGLMLLSGRIQPSEQPQRYLGGSSPAAANPTALTRQFNG